MKRKLPKYDNRGKIKLKDGVQTNKVDNTRVNYTPTFSKKPFTPENWATNINEIQPDGRPNPNVPGLEDATLDAMGALDLPFALGKLAAKGISKKLVQSGAKNFKSELDWAKWNSEIPKNPKLMQEYNDIEKNSKAANTWMKNPDGSKFGGTPEQFVQQNSTNFKQAFPDGFENVYRGKFGKTSDEIIRSGVFPSKGTFTGNKELAQNYTSKEAKNNILKPLSKTSEGGIYNLAHKKSKNSFELNYNGEGWSRLPLEKKEDLLNNTYSNFKTRLQEIKNLKKEDPETYGNIKNWVGNKISDTRAELKGLRNLKENDNDLLDNLSYRLGKETSTDDLAEYAEKYNIDNIKLNNISDGGQGDVTIVNHKKDNYLKSLVGNNGMFDMTNPNIYKTIIPATAVGASQMKNKKQSFKNGGRVLPKFNTGNIVPGYNIGKAAIGAGQEVQNTNQLNTNAGISMGAGAVSSLGTAAIDTFVDPNSLLDSEGNVVANVEKAGAAIGKGALKGAAAGAAIGSAVPVIGTAIGAGVGAIGGAAVGAFTNNKERNLAREDVRRANEGITTRNIMTRNLGSFIPMSTTNNNNYAKHGALISGPNAEVEGGEAIDLPENGSLSVVRGGEGTRTNSNSFMINGNSHEQSGIDIKATPGARVFNKEYSKIVNPINKAVGKMEKRLERTPMNLGLQAAIDRLNSRKDQLFEKQQMENESKNLNKFKDGGPIYEADNTGIYAGATTALLNNAVQSNRINNLPRPRTIQAPTFYAGSAPTPIDNSAELAQIGADFNSGRQMLRRGTSGAGMAANLGALNAIKAQANNRVYNAANTLNATRRDAYSERQAAAINAGIEAGYKTDVMNTENQANFNAWRVGAKNSATAGLTKDLVGMTNLYTDKENQKAELDAMLAANITGTGGRAGYVRPKARKFFKI